MEHHAGHNTNGNAARTNGNGSTAKTNGNGYGNGSGNVNGSGNGNGNGSATETALQLIRRTKKINSVTLDGDSLEIQHVLVSSQIKHDSTFQLTQRQPTIDRIDASLQFMLDRTNQSTYGVTTGFGAAATTRTDKVEALQVSILEHLLGSVTGFKLSQQAHLLVPPQHPTQSLGPNVLPESIVRAAILVRINSLARGHSACRIELLQGMIQLLNLSITPIVPLRGTISASGDLAPLAYIAGTLCGHPDVYVIDRSTPHPKVMSAAESLQSHGIEPIVLGPKEGLAVVNGTAFSAAAGSIAIYNAHVLGLLSQVLTAMTTEALMGQIGAFHPFIHETARPHPGQIEVAKNIYRWLQTSKLLDPHDQVEEKDLEYERSKQILRQDRYPLRTASQWIGPQLEDILIAHQTVSRELNSTTDNPLVDVQNGILHHGGNFQATSVATSMEKTRSAIAAIGKIMFAQTTELNNSLMNKGLPSCLNGDEPSTNYHTKGLDTASAAYCAELQYLAGPVTPHAQSAEGHNQSINSLAFISARKTLEAIEILKLLMASHLYCLCQALDLRVFEVRFKKSLPSIFSESIKMNFGPTTTEQHVLNEKLTNERFISGVVELFWESRANTASLDSELRTRNDLETTVLPILKIFEAHRMQIPVGSIENYLQTTRKAILNKLDTLKLKQGLDFGTCDYLSDNSRLIYNFVRNDLGVKVRRGDVFHNRMGPSIGSQVDKIFDAFKFDHPGSNNDGADLLDVLIQVFDP